MRPFAIAICALALICGSNLPVASTYAAEEGDRPQARQGDRECKRACLEKLDLSDEQREELKEARQSVRAAHKAADSREAHRAAHEAFVAEVKAILNAAQFKIWKAHHAKRMAERRANQGGEGKRGQQGDDSGDA